MYRETFELSITKTEDGNRGTILEVILTPELLRNLQLAADATAAGGDHDDFVYELAFFLLETAGHALPWDHSGAVKKSASDG